MKLLARVLYGTSSNESTRHPLLSLNTCICSEQPSNPDTHLQSITRACRHCMHHPFLVGAPPHAWSAALLLIHKSAPSGGALLSEYTAGACRRAHLADACAADAARSDQARGVLVIEHKHDQLASWPHLQQTPWAGLQDCLIKKVCLHTCSKAACHFWNLAVQQTRLQGWLPQQSSHALEGHSQASMHAHMRQYWMRRPPAVSL